MKEKIEYDIDRICRYCEHSSLLCDCENVLCDKKGVVSADYKCSRFAIDVMRIEPKRTKQIAPLEYVDIEDVGC